jgi:hypothetical protein
VHEWANPSLFALVTLTFELCLRKHHTLLVSTSSEKPKAAEFSNRIFWRKGWTITHEKCPFLLDMDCLVKKVSILTSSFT